MAVGGHLYLGGGLKRIVDYGKPSKVPGVERVEVESLRSFGRLDPATGAYRALAPLPEPLNHVGLVTYGGDIYLVGGHGNLLNGLEAKRGLFRYSVEEDRWERLAPMPTARGAAATAVVGDRLYVAGGMLRGRPLRTVEAYDFASGRWMRLRDLPEPLEHSPGAALGGAVCGRGAQR